MLPEWLNLNAPGFEELSNEEKNAIMHFSLLWSLFEAQVLNTSASANSICSKINSWSDAGILSHSAFEECKNYFVSRYIEDGNVNDHFTHLHLRKNDKSELVESVLKGDEKSVANVVSALLIIVFRYRNNFFHGVKWAYGLQGQLDNFNTANQLLMKVIELNKQI